MGDKVDVISWEFGNEGYNPYKGLIGRSDHFIVWGNSQSLISEPLFAGKTVHLYACVSAEGSKRRGLFAHFNDSSRSKPLGTHHFPSVNVTNELAEKLIQDSDERRTDKVQKFLGNLEGRDIPAAWRRPLVNIRFGRGTIMDVPESFLDSDLFLTEALLANPNCLRDLPGNILLDRRDVALAFVRSKHAAFYHLPEALRDDESFIKELGVPIGDIFDNLSERLKGSKEFIAPYVGANDSCI